MVKGHISSNGSVEGPDQAREAVEHDGVQTKLQTL